MSEESQPMTANTHITAAEVETYNRDGWVIPGGYAIMGRDWSDAGRRALCSVGLVAVVAALSSCVTRGLGPPLPRFR